VRRRARSVKPTASTAVSIVPEARPFTRSLSGTWTSVRTS
jgi:hypothetical protein